MELLKRLTKAVASTVGQMALLYILFLVVYVIAILISPYGLISTIIATIPLALVASMTLVGMLFTLYFILFVPGLQFYWSWKEAGFTVSGQSEAMPNHWKKRKFGFSLFNAGLLSALILSFVY